MNLRPLNEERARVLGRPSSVAKGKHTQKVPTFEVVWVDPERQTIKVECRGEEGGLELLLDGDILTVKERAWESLGWDARRSRQQRAKARREGK